MRVNPDVLYVDDGDVLTSAGSAAGIDLCLHIVRSDHGSAVANWVARRLVIPPHRDGGQAQLIELPMPAHPDGRPDRAGDGVGAGAAGRAAVTGDARRARLHERAHLHAALRRATGMSPGRWLIEQRVRASLPLLEGGDEPIETVAARVGFGSAATYRHHFAAIMRTSPTRTGGRSSGSRLRDRRWRNIQAASA